MSARLLVLSCLCALGAALASCVGDEPASQTPVPDAGGSSGSSSSSSGADAQAPVGRELGVFLTSQPYPANFATFAEDAPSDTGWNSIDAMCQSAAAAVPLPNAARYRAMVASASLLDETTRFRQLVESPRGDDRWCGISITTRAPACSASSLIFASPDAIQRGPTSTLLTNEFGSAAGSTGRFWSGLYIAADAGLLNASLETCRRWSLARPDGGLQGGVGTTAAVAEGAKEFGWVASERALCGRTELPLLCIELPAD